MLLLLAAQYIHGMTANLYVSFPDGYSGGQAWEFAWHQIPVILHILLGIGIIIQSIVLMVRAARSGNRALRNASIIGFIAILVAGGSGASFVPSQNDTFSYLMSLGFIVAFMAYGWSLSLLKSEHIG